MNKEELIKIKELVSKIIEEGTIRDEVHITFDIKNTPLVSIGLKEDIVYIKDDSKAGIYRPYRLNLFKKAALYWLYHKVFEEHK